MICCRERAFRFPFFAIKVPFLKVLHRRPRRPQSDHSIGPFLILISMRGRFRVPRNLRCTRSRAEIHNHWRDGLRAVPKFKPTTSCTAIRVPSTIAFPPQTSGKLVRALLSRLRNGLPLWASRSSSCLVQSQLQQAQASSPFKSRQFLRECASFTLNNSKYSSQYGRSSASGVGQKQTSTQRTVPSSSSRACSMSSRYSSPATEP